MQSNQCLECKRFYGPSGKEFGFTCEAFPDGIPDKIFTGLHNHTKPYKGDHGLRFKKREVDNG